MIVHSPLIIERDGRSGSSIQLAVQLGSLLFVRWSMGSILARQRVASSLLVNPSSIGPFAPPSMVESLYSHLRLAVGCRAMRMVMHTPQKTAKAGRLSVLNRSCRPQLIRSRFEVGWELGQHRLYLQLLLREIVPSFKNKLTALVAGTYSGVRSPEEASFSSRIRLI